MPIRGRESERAKLAVKKIAYSLSSVNHSHTSKSMASVNSSIHKRAILPYFHQAPCDTVAEKMRFAAFVWYFMPGSDRSYVLT